MGKLLKLIFVCDAGMGSSALGASILRKKLKETALNVEVTNASMDMDLPKCDLIVAHESFAEQLRKRYPTTHVLGISDFLNKESFQQVMQIMEKMNQSKTNEVLLKKNILIHCPSVSSDQAIQDVGDMLVADGYVMPEYIDGMFARDRELSVYLGNMLAIPHGEFEYKQYIKKSGIVLKIYPDGIDWHGENVKIVLGLAGIGEDHINILANCATCFGEIKDVEKIVAKQNIDEIYTMLTKEEWE